MTASPITSWKIDGEKMTVVTVFLFVASKILWMVTATMKSENICFLAGKL